MQATSPSVSSMKEQTKTFPSFDLKRLLSTVFDPKPNEKICILIDLDNPEEMADWNYLQKGNHTAQKHAYDVFYRGLVDGVAEALQLKDVAMFAYKATGGSNLDLPDTAVDVKGNKVDLKSEVYSIYDIVLCIGDWSGTAPLTALAKKYGFRGATMHGLNQLILDTGLAIDYNEVSRTSELLRAGMTHADTATIDFEIEGRKLQLRFDLDKQEAQKSHGICHQGPDIANLPAGEVYFVPVNVEGSFPLRYEDGTYGIVKVADGRAQEVTLLSGNQATVDQHNQKLIDDPATGFIGELGLGTQEYPPSGSDIQDEKVLGTIHVALGRNDHLGGSITPPQFHEARNATHDDILFSPLTTPEVVLKQVRLTKNGKTEVVIENFRPSSWMRGLLENSSSSEGSHDYAENSRVLNQYLYFHYCASDEILPYKFNLEGSLNFPVRCVTDCLDAEALSSKARALDVGCAVGRSTFELARHCREVIGIDASTQFIRAAETLKQKGRLAFEAPAEGELTTPCTAKIPEQIDRSCVRFILANAGQLDRNLGTFDVILAANVLCRLDDPIQFLRQLQSFVKPGGQLIIASPYSWSLQHTPRDHWLGGFKRNGRSVSSAEQLHAILDDHFALRKSLELPFLLRQHQRLYEWGVSQATVWIRKF